MHERERERSALPLFSVSVLIAPVTATAVFGLRKSSHSLTHAHCICKWITSKDFPRCSSSAFSPIMSHAFVVVVVVVDQLFSINTLSSCVQKYNPRVHHMHMYEFECNLYVYILVSLILFFFC